MNLDIPFGYLWRRHNTKHYPVESTVKAPVYWTHQIASRRKTYCLETTDAEQAARIVRSICAILPPLRKKFASDIEHKEYLREVVRTGAETMNSLQFERMMALFTITKIGQAAEAELQDYSRRVRRK